MSKVYGCVFGPVKSVMRKLYKNISQACGKVYQFELMKLNVQRGAHALTGLMFAPSVIMFS